MKARLGDLALLHSVPDDGTTRAWVYLIHLDRPMRHARHYCGMVCPSESLDALRGRLDQHAKGGNDSSCFMRAVYRNEITWRLVRIWPFDDFSQALAWEKKVKKKNPWYCPICKPSLILRSRMHMRLLREKRKENHAGKS